MKKILAIFISAIITFSICAMQAFAEETENGILWSIEKGRNGHIESDKLTYYSDGNLERIYSEFCYVVVTVPEGVEPSIEYFGVDRISAVSKFDEKFMYKTFYNEEIWSELEPGENEYLFTIQFPQNSTMNLCELEDEATEIAKNLLAEGKITSAKVNRKIHKYTFDVICGISITTDGTVESLNTSDFPELDGLYQTSDDMTKWYDNKTFSFDSIYTDKNTIANINSVCESLINNFDYIIEASPIVPSLYDLEVPETNFYAAESIYMWGDISRNNLIDLYDAIEISKYIMNITDIDEDTILLADINRDGVTDLYDAIEIAKALLP